ncbi:MAG: hypothetical protein AB1758_34080 [Candidatus Eremiobacterota bacterium]
MSSRFRSTLSALLWESAIYAPLVTVYFLLVMHLMSDFLLDLHQRNARLYAVVALVLLLGQAVVLDWLAGALMRLLGIRRR